MPTDELPARVNVPATQICAVEFMQLSDMIRVYQIAGIEPPSVLCDALHECRVRLDDACEEATHEKWRQYWRERQRVGFAA